jgi:predicted dehydrogenase
LGKNQILNKVRTSLLKRRLLHAEIDGKAVQGKIPTLQGIIMTFDEVYDLIANDKEETVTGQDGLRVMQIIEAAIKAVLRKSNQFIDKVKLSCTLPNHQAY